MDLDWSNSPYCMDGGCIYPRTSISLISLLCMIVYTPDMINSIKNYDISFRVRASMQLMKTVLINVFEIANGVLFVSAITEEALFISIYFFYVHIFIVMALLMSSIEIYQYKESISNDSLALVSLASDVVFLYVLSRCLPVIKAYKTQLEDQLI